MITILHNPRCSKSRQTLALLTEQGVEPTVVEYLKDGPDEKTLRSIAKKLRVAPRGMMRKGESVYKDLNLAYATDDQLFAAMASHPILIERPIVVNGSAARIGRPPESVLEIL